MPGIQLASRPEASTRQLEIRSCKETFKLFLELFQSCLGPGGKTKFIQNCAGGHLTITSSSSRLLSAVSINNPVLKFISSAIQSHLNNHGDGGLFFAIISSSLVFKGLDMNINRRVLSEVFEFLLTLSIEYLNTDKCIYRYNIDLSDINFMTAFLRTVLKTKPLCCLDETDIQQLTVILLECFLNSLNEKERSAPSDNVYIIVSETERIKHSKRFQGILLQAPELSSFKEVELSIKRTVIGSNNRVYVALVSTSLSADLEEVGGLMLRTEGDVDVESAVLDHLSAVCERWIQASVGLVLCQKVVHPQLKKLLRANDILVVDRIGRQPMQFLSKLSDRDIPVSMFGCLDDVRHTVLHDKSYLQLLKGDNFVTTLLLTHRQEQVLNEVKVLCQTTLSSLDQLLTVPYVLSGGGCWQSGLIHYIQHKVKKNVEDFAGSLEMSKMRFMEASQLYIEALLHTIDHQGTDLVYNRDQGHLYNKSHSQKRTQNLQTMPHCCCGLSKLDKDDQLIDMKYDNSDIGTQQFENDEHISGAHQTNDMIEGSESGYKVPKKENILWDSLSVRRNALQMSVLTACAVLRIGHAMDTG